MHHPLATAALGALCIASSGVLVRLAATTPVTVAVYRCLYALPFLLAITLLGQRRFGGLPRRSLVLAWIAGTFFATDLIFWHNAIEAVGAGLATVLGNLQVVIVGLYGLRTGTGLRSSANGARTIASLRGQGRWREACEAHR